MSYIQLPYGFVKNNKQIQFILPRNYEDSQYIKRLPYISNKGPDVENNILNALKNREDFRKWLLATSDYGQEMQDDLNAIVGYNEKFFKILQMWLSVILKKSMLLIQSLVSLQLKLMQIDLLTMS